MRHALIALFLATVPAAAQETTPSDAAPDATAEPPGTTLNPDSAMRDHMLPPHQQGTGREPGHGMGGHGDRAHVYAHHPELALRGQARISIRDGERRLTILCGDAEIADCVEGARPVIDLMR